MYGRDRSQPGLTTVSPVHLPYVFPMYPVWRREIAGEIRRGKGLILYSARIKVDIVGDWKKFSLKKN